MSESRYPPEGRRPLLCALDLMGDGKLEEAVAAYGIAGGRSELYRGDARAGARFADLQRLRRSDRSSAENQRKWIRMMCSAYQLVGAVSEEG